MPLTICGEPCTIPLKKWKMSLFSEMLNPLSLCGYFTVSVVGSYISLAAWERTKILPCMLWFISHFYVRTPIFEEKEVGTFLCSEDDKIEDPEHPQVTVSRAIRREVTRSTMSYFLIPMQSFKGSIGFWLLSQSLFCALKSCRTTDAFFQLCTLQTFEPKRKEKGFSPGFWVGFFSL